MKGEINLGSSIKKEDNEEVFGELLTKFCIDMFKA